MKVLVVGDLSISIAAEAPRLPRPAENMIVANPLLSPSGVAANISSTLRWLGIDTYVSGVVGGDVFGEVILRELGSWGVHTKYVGKSEGPTSFFLVIVDRTGERTMIGYRGASETLHLDPRLIETVRPDWVHVSGYTLLNKGIPKELGKFIEAALARGFFSLDLEGIAYSRTRLRLEGTYVFCNLTEYHTFFASEKLASPSQPFTVVVKAGSKGSYLLKDRKVRRFGAFRAEARDTNGAGDAFNAAFICARLKGLEDDEASVWGNACASLKIAQLGPHPRISRERVEGMARGGS